MHLSRHFYCEKGNLYGIATKDSLILPIEYEEIEYSSTHIPYDSVSSYEIKRFKLKKGGKEYLFYKEEKMKVWKLEAV